MAGFSTIFSLILTRITAASNIRSVNEAIGQPPLIHEGPPAETQIYHVGQRLTLPCRATGSPPPRYHWYKDGRLLEELLDFETNLFVIHPAHLGDLHIKTKQNITNGYYQCLAQNEYGQDRSNITYLQEAVFTDLQPRRVVQNLSAIDGRHLVLQCNHVISVPLPTVYWYTAEMTSRSGRQSHYSIRPTERLATDDTGGLVIIAVTKSDARDDLVYKCQVYNYVIRQTSAGGYFRIQVQEEPYDTGSPPELIYSSTKLVERVGSNVTLTCIFSGRPLPTIGWTRKGGVPIALSARITDFGRRLVLTNVKVEDEGHYTCSASNEIAVTQTIVGLTIVAAPSIQLFPESRTTTAGTTETFTCQGQGRPSPTVTWYINAQPINSSSTKVRWETRNSTLTLFDLQLDDTSTITCNISNDFGYVLSSAYLRVLPPLPTPSVVIDETSAVDVASTTESDVIMTSAVTTSSSDDVGVEMSSDNSLKIYETDPSVDEIEIYSTEFTSEESVTVETILSHHEPGASDLSRGGQGESGKGGSKHGSHLMDTFLMRIVWFLIPIVFLVIFGCIVWQRYRNRKTSYKVEEQEKRRGQANGVDYDSEDSGYDEQRAADRRLQKFKVAEKDEN